MNEDVNRLTVKELMDILNTYNEVENDILVIYGYSDRPYAMITVNENNVIMSESYQN